MREGEAGTAAEEPEPRRLPFGRLVPKIGTSGREALGGLADIVWPPRCLVCGRPGEEPLCPACLSSFVPLGDAVCSRCGVPCSAPLCPECSGGAARYFSRCRAPGLFDGTLRRAIVRLKYEGKRRLAAPLGAYLTQMLLQQPFAPDIPDILVPVPLHSSRRRSRGFNQSALLAREVSRRTGIPVCECALLRIRRTRPQVELSRSERAANIQGAFAVPDPALVAGRTLLLLDDVVTTCHTVDECARVLVNAGARAVYVASLARGG